MPDSNRGGDPVLTLAAIGALIALCVCAAGIVLNEYAKVQQGYAAYQRNAAEDRHEAAEKAAQACKDRDVTALAACVANQLEAHASKQSTNQDLQAQQDMAFWAMWMFIASGGTILVTGVGVYLVWQTLEATREAVAAANRTADEAKRIGEAQVRAYLAFKSATIRIQKYTPDRFDIFLPAVELTIENVGNSTARDIFGYISVAYLYPEVRTKAFCDLPKPKEPTGLNASPGQPQRLSLGCISAHLGSDVLRVADEGGLKVVVTAYVSFTDVFDVTCSDEFHFEADIPAINKTIEATQTSRSVEKYVYFHNLAKDNARRRGPRLPGKNDDEQENGESSA